MGTGMIVPGLNWAENEVVDVGGGLGQADIRVTSVLCFRKRS